ncbi:FxsA family membrane protein [Streptomyces sp. NPDC050560]|uniref:FxsA family membrane protein n=1 Tax=Streptomyces sp. NPDC050560 TaxID=3365630 RepID=UPI00379BCFFA
MSFGTPTPSPTRTPPRRSRARRLVPVGIAVWLILEIWLLTLIGSAAGGFAVFLLLVAGVVLGAVVMKGAGRRAFRNLTRTVQAQQRGEMPPDEGRSEGNGLLMLAGLLLMIPGPIGDGAGLLLLLPPLRRSLASAIQGSVERRVRAAYPGGPAGGPFGPGRGRGGSGDGKVVQGEVVHDDSPPEDRDPRDDGPRPPLTG